MSITRLIAVFASAAAVFAAPSVAVAVGPPSNPGADHRPATTPSQSANHPAPATAPAPAAPTSDVTPGATDEPTPPPNAPVAEKAKAYGTHCQDESKKHVAGEQGTPFSRCVTAMAKAATGAKKSARAACAGMSKKHVKGERGTAFSRCVVEAAKLLPATR